MASWFGSCPLDSSHNDGRVKKCVHVRVRVRMLRIGFQDCFAILRFQSDAC